METAELTRRRLTQEQVQFYQDNGYLIVKGVLSPEEVARYKKRAREIILGDYPPGCERLIVQDVRVARGAFKPADPELGIWKLLNPQRIDKMFEQYPESPALADVVEDLIGPDFMAFLLMFIYKPPGLIDAIHPFHQDSFYFPFAPHDAVLGTWVALDKTDKENGTLGVIPGSHRLEVLPHIYPESEMVNFGVFGVEGYDNDPSEVILDLEPGDGAFFHSRLLHRTGPNTSERHRRVLTVHYASSQCKFTGESFKEFGFRLVRGQKYDGCIT